MAPTLRRNWWTVRRYHWMLRMGSLPPSRRVAIRLTRLTPRRCFPKAAPSSSAWGRQLRRQRGQTRAMKTCSVTCAGTRGRSMTSRVRWVQPPDNGVPQSGQLSTACSIRWVRAIRRREKPWGRGFRDCWGAGDFGLDRGLTAGHPRWSRAGSFVLQLGDTPFQAANDRLLLDEGDELVAPGGVQVGAGIHVICIRDCPGQRQSLGHHVQPIHLTNSEQLRPRTGG